MPKKQHMPAAPTVRESCFLHGDYEGQCAGCAKIPEGEPRLRTQSDEVQELRGALIAMLWEHVGHAADGDAEESCNGQCEDRSASGPGLTGPAAPACAAVRALGWAEHFDARSFEQRASR